MSFPRDMILGEGVFSIGDALTTSTLTDIGAVRGGGKFTVNRTYRRQKADGDYGFVKGRIQIDEEVATLTIRALELLPANLNDFYPALTEAVSTTTGLYTITSNLVISSNDYQKVRFTGRTNGGNAVQITLDNAINMANIDWNLLDKDEVVPELVFTATSLEATTTVPCWELTMATT